MSQKRSSRHKGSISNPLGLAVELKAQGDRLKVLAKALKESTRELKATAKYLSKMAKAVRKDRRPHAKISSNPGRKGAVRKSSTKVEGRSALVVDRTHVPAVTPGPGPTISP